MFTVIFAPEMGTVNSITVVQGAPNEVLDTCGFRGVDKVFSLLGFVGFGLGYVIVVDRKESKNCQRDVKINLFARWRTHSLHAGDVDQRNVRNIIHGSLPRIMEYLPVTP